MKRLGVAVLIAAVVFHKELRAWWWAHKPNYRDDGARGSAEWNAITWNQR